ncbi:amidohydrolase family protein [Terriglobus albidus]|uniref:amidohydrolase family protein n=1 Tax=Terriglobus albidus TaxID=1592106 RepID=UPI0021E0BFCF|nr:amidohydrolase family protein [Terriglobus albidus]
MLLDSNKPDEINSARVCVDAHHHLWEYDESQYDWISREMPELRRDFLPADLKLRMEEAGVDGAVTVQARQTIGETEWLLKLAAQHSFLYGVVGWAPIAEDSFPALLERFSDAPKLLGLRHIVQAEPAGFLDAPAFNRGIDRLQTCGLIYDILIFQHQLEEAIRFVDRHPNQQFVVDHAAKPRIAAREIEPWAANLRELAKRPNVVCKVSGLVTEGDWKFWSTETLAPYLDTCLEAFGADRLMAGSDWPVCLLATDYKRWWNFLREYFAALSDSERQSLFAETCCRTYKIQGKAI